MNEKNVSLKKSILTALSILLLSGCADKSNSSNHANHDHGPGGHSHATASAGAPHGGTPVVVGDHGFHLELVPDVLDGKMLAYVFDAHMEKSVNVSGAPFEMVAKTGAQEHRLTFQPVTNAPAASAEKTSLFSANVPNIKSLTNFEGQIPKITLEGRSFENVKFNYPKGSRHEH